ncbi:hypothetical protein SAMN02746066_04663, partial [Anaerosporobacter mobilis DSM 15930]
KEKVVKCKKEHTCVICQRTIDKGKFALSESGFCDGEAVSAYTCIECVENVIEESGEVDASDDEYIRIEDENGIIWRITNHDCIMKCSKCGNEQRVVFENGAYEHTSCYDCGGETKFRYWTDREDIEREN